MNPNRISDANFVRTDDAIGLMPMKAVEAAEKSLAAAVPH
jgi:hypothetical protein